MTAKFRPGVTPLLTREDREWLDRMCTAVDLPVSAWRGEQSYLALLYEAHCDGLRNACRELDRMPV